VTRGVAEHRHVPGQAAACPLPDGLRGRGRSRTPPSSPWSGPAPTRARWSTAPGNTTKLDA